MRPIWSIGCDACRRMKKKCDEAKPECARCVKGGRQCPGYRSDQEAVFRSMNDSAMARVNKPTTLATIPGAPQPFFIQPSTDWAQYAISRFVSHFSVGPSELGLPGYLEFLPTMLNSADLSFQTSLLATSLASLANVSGMQQLHTESRVQYGRALQSLRTSLSDKATATEDHTLLAVVLLQKYEAITGNANFRKDPHEKATTEMLRLRIPGQGNLSNRGSRLARAVSIRKEIIAMDDRQESPMEIGKGHVGTDQPVGASLRLFFRDTFISSQRLREFSDIQGQATPVQMKAFTKAWKFAAGVYNRLALWPSALPPAWKLKPYVLPTTPPHIQGLTNQRGEVYLFPGPQHGAVWNGYLCSQIHLCQVLLKAYHFVHRQRHIQSLQADLTPSEDDVLETMHSTVDDIFGTSPYLFGDIDSEGRINTKVEKKSLGAFFLLRSADVALSVETLSESQQRTILHLLGRIGTEFGIRLASNRRDRWLIQHPDQA